MQITEHAAENRYSEQLVLALACCRPFKPLEEVDYSLLMGLLFFHNLSKKFICLSTNSLDIVSDVSIFICIVIDKIPICSCVMVVPPGG